MQGPVLENEAEDKHENAQGPEDSNGGHLAVAAIAYPQPAQQQHGQTIDRP